MTSAHAKVAVLALGLFSLVLLVAAARERWSGRVATDRTASAPSGAATELSGWESAAFSGS